MERLLSQRSPYTFSFCLKLLWLGIFVPVIDVCLIGLFASLHPDYDHLRQLMSELGEEGRPYAGLVNAWFALSSVLLIGFGVGLASALPRSPVALVGVTLFIIWAALGIGSAALPCDPGCQGKTISGWLHLLLGEMAAAAMLPVPTLIWRAVGRGDARRGFGLLTAVVQLVAVISSIGMTAAAYEAEIADRSLRELAGLFQRICWADYYLWIVVMAIQMLRSTRG
jgi:hypothetical protein